MLRTSAGSKPRARTCSTAVSSALAWTLKAVVNGVPRRPRGSRVSSSPMPVSTRTRESAVSISRQWQMTGVLPNPPLPAISRFP